MASDTRSPKRRAQPLSQESIIRASIEILDSWGESGLTFQVLSKRLRTGPGAIYGHVANRSDLVASACNAIVNRALESCAEEASPTATVCALALSMFNAIDAHPWIGSALVRADVRSPLVLLQERLGRQLQALGVPEERQWTMVSVLMNYILGVGSQNAANGQFARRKGLNRSTFLTAVSIEWSQLDSAKFPFTRSVAAQLLAHDERADFVAGVELILDGIGNLRERRRT